MECCKLFISKVAAHYMSKESLSLLTFWFFLLSFTISFLIKFPATFCPTIATLVGRIRWVLWGAFLTFIRSESYKCGTTDLWDKVVQHPEVLPVPKEPHWWAWRRFGFVNTPIHGPLSKYSLFIISAFEMLIIIIIYSYIVPYIKSDLKALTKNV